MNFESGEIPVELDDKEMKIPRYAGKIKSIRGRGEKMRDSEIGVWINTYDDIFSDFDSRPYSQRALSDDFLLEMKRASRDKPGGEIELIIFAPEKMRSFSHEALIKRRLIEHFRRHHTMLHHQLGAIKRKGIWLSIFGVLMILGATYISSFRFESLLKNLGIVIFEPGGWFLAWTGLEHIFYKGDTIKPDLDFYEKMSNVQIDFKSF